MSYYFNIHDFLLSTNCFAISFLLHTLWLRLYFWSVLFFFFFLNWGLNRQSGTAIYQKNKIHFKVLFLSDFIINLFYLDSSLNIKTLTLKYNYLTLKCETTKHFLSFQFVRLHEHENIIAPAEGRFLLRTSESWCSSKVKWSLLWGACI